MKEAFEIGSIVAGTYKILEFIGQGGMGHVFKVEHLVLAKIEAMKVLRQEQVSSEIWQRFRTEAQAIARVDHQNIIKIYDMSQTADGLPFYTMEFLSGVSLADHLDDVERLSVKDALPIFEQVCNGLGYAHDRGIIHRDIKPGNIMILNTENKAVPVVKIVDFGIAKLLSYDSNVSQGLTRPGDVFGSPLYMSPEQAQGVKVDYRTDMYSVGVTMFQALTGRPPFVGKSAVETVAMHQTDRPPLLRDVANNVDFPLDLERLVGRLLSKDPEERYLSLYDVAEQLKTLAQGKRLTPVSPTAPLLEDEEIDTTDGDEQKRRLFVYTPIICILIAAIGCGAYFIYDQINLARKPKKPVITYFTPKPNLVVTPQERKAEDSELDHPQQNQQEDRPITRADIENVKAFLATNKRMYSKVVRIDGVDQLQFKFPIKFKLGKIDHRPNDRTLFHDAHPAQGTVTVPLKEELRLGASNILKVFPQLLSYFRPNDLKELTLPNLPRNHAAAAESLTKLTGLRNLDLHYGTVGNADLKWLEKMPSLTRVNFTKTEITPEALAKSPLLARVDFLEIQHMRQITPILKALVKYKKIVALNITDTQGTSEDYKLVSQMSSLKRLIVRENNITDADIAELSKLDLFNLNLQEAAGLTAKSLEYFPRFKHMRHLAINFAFSSEQVQQLKNSMPKETIINDE